MTKRLQAIFTVFVTWGLLECVSLLKINILFGAKTAMFSGFAVAGPLAGMYAGMGITGGVLALRRLVKCLFLGTSLFSPFSLYLPTLAAGFYLKSRSWLMSIAVPLVCMALFMLHPVGGQAWYYTLYWLIPVAFWFVPAEGKGQFLSALGATFVQHAVGSVLWLYFMPTSAAVWTALLPIVFVERILCAIGMVVIMRVVENGRQVWRSTCSLHVNSRRV